MVMIVCNGIDVKRVSLSTVSSISKTGNRSGLGGNGVHFGGWRWAAPRDSESEEIIHILMRAPFAHRFSWSWQTLMFVLYLKHLVKCHI